MEFSRVRPSVARVLALILVAGACTVSPPQPNAETASSGPSPLAANNATDAVSAGTVAQGELMCLGEAVNPQPDDLTLAEATMSGVIALGENDPAELPDKPKWGPDPTRGSNWSFIYQSLTWVDRLRRTSAISGDEAMRQRYRDMLVDGWESNGQSVKPTTSQNVQNDYRWFDMSTA